MRRPLASLAVAPLVLLAAAPAAQAGSVTFGSDLAKPATLVESRGADTAFWQRSLPSGGTFRVPVEGQVKSVKVRGFAQSDNDWKLGDPGPFRGGERLVFVQVLQPLSDGRYKVREFGTSQGFYLPGRNQQGSQDTISTFEPNQMCAEPGDAIAFNTVGGFNAEKYPTGTPLQVFADVPGAVIDHDQAVDHTNNGDTLNPEEPLQGKELLMQVTMTTGTDAEGGCRTAEELAQAAAAAPTARKYVTVPNQRITVPKSGKITAAVFCLNTTGGCAGTLTVLSKGRSIGAGRFAIPKKGTGKVAIALSKAGFKAITKAKAKGLPVTLSAVTDGIPGAQTRAIVLKRRGA